MNSNESAENYLERILMLQNEGKSVRSVDLATSFNYSRASISRAITNLKANKYIIVLPNGIIQFTQKGYKLASKILDRHTSLTQYFMQLGVSETIAKEDACKIEHDLSQETYEAIIKTLNKER